MHKQREERLIEEFRLMSEKEKQIIERTVNSCAERRKQKRARLRLITSVPVPGFLVDLDRATG